MKRERRDRIICFCMIFTGAALSGGFLYTVWIYVPRDDIRYLLAGLYGGLCVLGLLGNFRQRRQICRFADERWMISLRGKSRREIFSMRIRSPQKCRESFCSFTI